ncbi:PREDICTED: very-long-chain (3R)-3-hydroxyacyl-CoA dehydratase 2-like [Priapulus caudatus]|uniref:Very-long-chain (3R)-3-hydroxyacyl-CoA dehydratase n=1 Tax=Priapulus caudatus TaxID=37621 RepID=A0ABM1F405_PRICU|nr:PREDICTED: very-long-chain (3R)-3-hydroxyacyl-CoA dehydratase 2-like [Priapulus caudatus]
MAGRVRVESRNVDGAGMNTKQNTMGRFSKGYLVLYNIAMAFGWAAIGLMLIRHYVYERSYFGLYRSVEPLLKVFQTAAVLEVVHCAVGLVRSSVYLTAMQVYSRVFLVWGIIVSVPDVGDKAGIVGCLTAWTVTEVVRYSFYAFTLVDALPRALLWCRYTLFLPLYPIGVTGELLTIWNALPTLQRTRMYSIELPNAANISFSYYYYVLFVCMSYVPIFPQLYCHMVKQRRKVLNGKMD